MRLAQRAGDACKFNGSVAFGTRFAEDRGNMIAAFSYTKQDPLNGNSRSFFFDKTPSSFIGTGTFVPAPPMRPMPRCSRRCSIATASPAPAIRCLQPRLQQRRHAVHADRRAELQGRQRQNGYAVIGGNVRMPVGQQVDS